MQLPRQLLAKFVLLLILVEFIFGSQVLSVYLLISVFLQKCYGTGNSKYCNFTTSCRPFNRTAKWSSTNLYFHPGVIFEAPINVEIIAYKKFRTVYRQHMLKLKTEMCAQLSKISHPYFSILGSFDSNKGNFFDPCPIQGYRYIKPRISTFDHVPLVPIGEWRLDFIISKNINGSEEVLFSWSDFYDVKPTSAIEF